MHASALFIPTTFLTSFMLRFQFSGEYHRERERQRQRQRQRETETERQRQTETDRERDTERDRETDRETDRDRQTETDRQRQRERDRERERQRQTERETDRERDCRLWWHINCINCCPRNSSYPINPSIYYVPCKRSHESPLIQKKKALDVEDEEGGLKGGCCRLRRNSPLIPHLLLCMQIPFWGVVVYTICRPLRPSLPYNWRLVYRSGGLQSRSVAGMLLLCY